MIKKAPFGHKNFSLKSKTHFYLFFNACRQIQFLKNLMNRHKEKFKSVNFAPKPKNGTFTI